MSYFSTIITKRVISRVLLFFVLFSYFPFWDPPGSLPVDSLDPVCPYAALKAFNCPLEGYRADPGGSWDPMLT